MSGFFLMHRDVFDHHLFDGSHERFYAWSWLIAKAAWQETQFDVGGKTITLQRGQLCYSIRKLSEKWRMSKGATERFINRLKIETMIEAKAGHGRMLITICNYSDYQTIEKPKRDKVGTVSGAKLGQSWDIKETLETLKTDIGSTSGDADPDLFLLTADQEEATNEAEGALKPEHVREAFNAVAGRVGLPRADKWTAKRKKLVAPFLKRNTLEEIQLALANLERSGFCQGRNQQGWKMGFDDFLHEEKFVKLMEGKYG